MPREKSRSRKISAADDLPSNVLLHQLGKAGRSKVATRGALVDLAPDERIYENGESIRDVFFPLDSVLAIVMLMRDGHQIALGSIGREGTSAYPLLLGTSISENDCFCKVPGSAIKIRIGVFRDLISAYPTFRRCLELNLRAYVNVLGCLAACNRLHSVHQRCARWLLQTSDRVGVKPISMTHDSLAVVLGTDRPGVSVAADLLRRAGLIDYGHGAITIMDRAGLEAASCECYVAMRKYYGPI